MAKTPRATSHDSDDTEAHADTAQSLQEIDEASEPETGAGDLGGDFDLDNLKPVDEARPLHLSHPQTGADLFANGQPLVVHVLGPDHPEMKKLEHKTANRRLQQATRTGQVTMTAKQTEEDALNRSVAATKGWENIRQGGKDVECTPENVRRIYSEWPWMRRQVDAFHSNAGNFLSGGATS